VLPVDAFQRWIIAPTKRIVAGVKAVHPAVPIIGFPRGAGMLYPSYISETGIDAVSLDTMIPPAWAAANLQPKVAVQGNLDPIRVVAGGAEMIAATDRIVDAFAGGAHVFNLGHGFIPSTPPEHVAALSDHLRGLGNAG
jgi:uroporphyrinogen decarboxylase